ncbi:MAG: DoxX family membrane protein [Gemmataceae bacterium]
MSKAMILFRLVAGLPLLVLGAKHFIDPQHFKNILVASELPMPEVSAIAAPVAECLAGLLLLLGVFARLGGLLGIATMAPAIYSTIQLAKLDPNKLPAGLTEVPFVPPLPVPIAVLVCSLLVVLLGAGAWSVDAARGKKA